MPSLFQRLFATEEVESISVATEGLENAIVRVMRGDTEEGLISAEELPSAAKALAELFPSEVPVPDHSVEASTALPGNSASWEQSHREHETRQTESETAESSVHDEGAPAASAVEPQQAQSAEVIPANEIADAEIVEALGRSMHEAEQSEKPSEPPLGGSAIRSDDAPVTGEQATQEVSEIYGEPRAEVSTDQTGLDEADHEVLFAAAAELLQEPQEENSTAIAEPSIEGEMTSPASSDPVDAAIAEVSSEATSPLDRKQQDAPRVPAPPRDWAFEEKLAEHHEWLESQGASGRKADFAGAELAGTELIGVNFRFADMHNANLKDADLLLADLRDACLMRTNLEEACLVGANLEGANLEGATLDTAMGLVPRQVAGANLRDASLPLQITEFPAMAEFTRASLLVYRYFVASAATMAVCWLMLWRTKDIQLVTDSAVFGFLHSRAAAAACPTAQIFLLAPLVLFALYAVFHFHLQSLCDATLELPAIFPDGRALGDKEKPIVLGLLRAHFRWIQHDNSSRLLAEKAISVVVAYWMVPITLLLFWARYLTVHDIHGTVLHVLLTAIAAGLALHAATKVGRPPENWATGKQQWMADFLRKLRSVNILKAGAWTAGVLLLLSTGVFLGVPHDRSRAPQYAATNMRRWVPDLLWAFGYDPYADLTEAEVSRRPANWTGADSQVSGVSGPRLNGVKLRYAQAYGAFFVDAHLLRANLQGAFLSDADFRGADLGEAKLRFATLDSTRLNSANLNRANIEGADLSRADLRSANLSYALLNNATLMDARLDGASLYDSQMMSATLTRANLEAADLRGSALNAARLERADLRHALLWSARLPGADLQGAQLREAILIGADLRGVDLRGAQFQGAVLSEADMSGANLDDADLRGAGGLTANQVCSAKSRRGALLDATLATQVGAQCGLVGGQGSATTASTSQDRAATDVAP
jgi:uncharacterized protein YjbI with pentapeptide repeats